MDEMLTKLFNNEVFSEETKKEISDTFQAALAEARAQQEKALREEFATRYDSDKEKIAEAIQQYVDQKNEAEMVEFMSDWKALNEQRMKYVNAQATLKEQAKVAIQKRLSIFEKAMRRALVKETKELHEDLRINRAAAVRAISEAKSLCEADRQAFRTKGAKVLEHILQVQFDSKMRAMQEDIDKAKQNDFGSRIFEAFMGEARRLFFNSNKELRGLMKTMNEMQQTFATEKADLVQKVTEAQTLARKAMVENKTIKESAIRSAKMSKMLATVPAGIARDKMRTLLEAQPVQDMEKAFKKFAPSILSEAAPAPQAKTRQQLEEHAARMSGAVLRTGNGRQAIVEDEDDDEIDQLRALAGIVRR